MLLAMLLASAAAMGHEAEAVREAFRHSMAGYSRHAWGHDEIRPTTNRTNDSWGGFGVYLYDALDTAMVMEENDLADRVVSFLAQGSFLKDWDAHVFEYSIRYLGGALSAYQMRGRRDVSLLANAQILGERLAVAFATGGNGLPSGIVNLQSGQRRTAEWLAGNVVLAEAGSIQLEFAVLSAETGNDTFRTVSRKAFDHLVAKQPADGMFPLFIGIESGEFRDQSASSGALGDSFFEMLIKLWLFDGADLSSPLMRAWNATWAAMKRRMLRRSGKSGLLFLGEIGPSGETNNKMGHLSCHMPAVLALAFKHTGDHEYLKVAEELAGTCWKLYEDTATGLGPETVEFIEQGERDYKILDSKSAVFLCFSFVSTSQLLFIGTFCVPSW